MTKNRKKIISITAAIILAAAIALIGGDRIPALSDLLSGNSVKASMSLSKDSLPAKNLSDKSIRETIPAYSGEPTCEINNGKPKFKKSEIKTKAYERLGDLDSQGRCTEALACLGKEIMPGRNQERGSISEIHPTGWHSVQYKSVSGGSLYNRCHLIGWQLTGNDAVDRNLMTGTRYMNVEGMEPFESEVAEYLRSTGNHVMYRVTPVFKGDEELARGVHMEAMSVEDGGSGISFNIYCYNVQPKIQLNYKTGESKSTISGDANGYRTQRNGRAYSTKPVKSTSGQKSNGTKYIVNTNTRKFHKPDCYSVKKMSESNTWKTNESRDKLISGGYEPCGNCHP